MSKKKDPMDQLYHMDWAHRFDSHITYYKKINSDLEVMVNRHINDKKWSVSIMDVESGEEICVNYDASFEWLMDFVKLLETEEPITKKDKSIGSNLDLNKLEKELDEALEKETPETLAEWLRDKRKMGD